MEKVGGGKCDFVNHTKSCLRKLINQKKYEAWGQNIKYRISDNEKAY